ncbi:UNKNOWN [Stylonychia lemnae]|uniref:Uncharacterized protein n=1 Tax=Stylonychia lemnae TaxID=5949 RepID=A0A078B8X2_STYLE|nr:UNKNOWN [Stylonychia lemnae]|eukprot:CDW90676.1 UNKNOWN [Stylonychia lemnae]
MSIIKKNSPLILDKQGSFKRDSQLRLSLNRNSMLINETDEQYEQGPDLTFNKDLFNSVISQDQGILQPKLQIRISSDSQTNHDQANSTFNQPKSLLTVKEKAKEQTIAVNKLGRFQNRISIEKHQQHQGSLNRNEGNQMFLIKRITQQQQQSQMNQKQQSTKQNKMLIQDERAFSLIEPIIHAEQLEQFRYPLTNTQLQEVIFQKKHIVNERKQRNLKPKKSYLPFYDGVKTLKDILLNGPSYTGTNNRNSLIEKTSASLIGRVNRDPQNCKLNQKLNISYQTQTDFNNATIGNRKLSLGDYRINVKLKKGFSPQSKNRTNSVKNNEVISNVQSYQVDSKLEKQVTRDQEDMQDLTILKQYKDQIICSKDDETFQSKVVFSRNRQSMRKESRSQFNESRTAFNKQKRSIFRNTQPYFSHCFQKKSPEQKLFELEKDKHMSQQSIDSNIIVHDHLASYSHYIPSISYYQLKSNQKELSKNASNKQSRNGQIDLQIYTQTQTNVFFEEIINLGEEMAINRNLLKRQDSKDRWTHRDSFSQIKNNNSASKINNEFTRPNSSTFMKKRSQFSPNKNFQITIQDNPPIHSRVTNPFGNIYYHSPRNEDQSTNRTASHPVSDVKKQMTNARSPGSTTTKVKQDLSKFATQIYKAVESRDNDKKLKKFDQYHRIDQLVKQAKISNVEGW